MARSSIDGYVVEYLCAGEELALGATDDVRGYDARVDLATFDHPRVRRAILEVAMRRGPHRYFGAVCWGDGRDLDQLDTAARRGDDIDDALGAGLFCQVHTVRCLACEGEQLVATPDMGLPIVTPARLGSVTLSSTCPTCGHERYVRYAELFVGG